MSKLRVSLPAWAWVGAIVVCSTGVRFAFARHVVGPWIMIDEIVYSELAKSFAATGSFAVRGVPTSGYGVIYPVLISPAYALFRSIPAAYTAIKLINALLMSLAAVPAYLLARRVLSTRGSLIVAVLTVAVPSTFYAGMVMTESAFYPIFLVAALALVMVLERPRFLSAVLFVAALGLAYETRAQAIAILPAALTAPFLIAALSRRPRELLAHRPLFATTAGVAVLAVAAELGRGRSLSSLLGAYAAATHSSYDVGSVLRWLLWHLSELQFYVGAVPVFALILLCVRGPSLHAADRAVVAATVALVAWFGVEVAAFASQPSVQRIEERNLFYVAPLLFTCLLLWIERGLPRPRPAALAAAAGVVVLAAAVPYDRFIGTPATSDTFGVLTLWSMALWLHVPAGDIRWVVAGGALVVVACAAVGPRRAWIALPLLVLALDLAAIQPVDSRIERASIGAVFQGITRSDRDWIAAAVGSGDEPAVAVIWSGVTDRLTVNENEFFSRAVGPIYTVNGPLPDGLAQSPITLDRSTGRYRAQGKDIQVSDVLVDTGVAVVGTRIAADERKGLTLLRVEGPLRAPYSTAGIYGDAWSGPRASYRRYDCAGGRLRVELGSDRGLFDGRITTVEAHERGKLVGRARVRAGGTTVLDVPLLPSGSGTCNVAFRVSPTRVPAVVQPGSTDSRLLGVRFLGFHLGGGG
jgi:hypothetical protein